MHKKENIVQPNLTVMVGRQGIPPPFYATLAAVKGGRRFHSFPPGECVLTHVLSSELHEPAS